MASGQAQISAYISEEAKELLERYAEAQGLKKGHIVEAALLHHLQALRELPADIIIPPRLVVSEGSGKKILARVKRPRAPTEAMKELFATDDDEE